MPRQLWIADKLRAYGLTVVEVTGWQDRARPGAFDPLGVMVHHTAAPKGKDHPSLQVCIDGRPGLAGPLCNVLLARNCTCYVISAGRCNHAGAGAWGRITDGNRHFLGIEAENDGIGEPWAPDMLDAFYRATAALLEGLSGGDLIAHREWAPNRKSDPKGIDMAHFRTRVAALKPTGDTMPTTPTPPTGTERDLIAQWQGQLIANGARLGDAGPNRDGKDGVFGRLALDASTTVLNHRNQLLAQVAKLEADLAGARRELDRLNQLLTQDDGERAGLRLEVEQLRALADVATRGPALLAIVQGLRAQLNEAEAKLQGLA